MVIVLINAAILLLIMLFPKRGLLRQSIIGYTLLPQEDTVVLHSSDSSPLFFPPGAG